MITLPNYFCDGIIIFIPKHDKDIQKNYFTLSKKQGKMTGYHQVSSFFNLQNYFGMNIQLTNCGEYCHITISI